MQFTRIDAMAVEEDYVTTPFPCGAEVRGERRGHCTGCYGGFDGCCRTFYGIEAWNKHRTGPMADRRCRTDEELRKKGLVLDGDVWRMASQDLDDDPSAPDAAE